jgi:GAF domain-containing protein
MKSKSDDHKAALERENAELRRQLAESLTQQTAAAEVLQVINSSPGDLAPVFEAILEKAVRLCQASFGILWNFDGDLASAGALHQVPQAYAALCRSPFRPSRESGPARMIRGEGTLAIVDVRDSPGYRDGDPLTRAIADLAGARSIVIAPLRRDTGPLGAITLYRQEVRPFTDKQIALLESFAAQAVIAMENARLITETREALEQQTATAEVLQVINSSPGDIVPVFDAMLEKAVRLSEADHGVIWTQDGERYRAAALRDVPEKLAEFLRGASLPLGPGTFVGRVMRERSPLHIADTTLEEPYRQGVPIAVAGVELGGARTILTVPLLKGDALVGIFQLTRREVRPFTDKQITLMQNFAVQAVIAMENARLITETREALEQQTATSEVLQIINSSPGDLAPVFEAMLDKALRLCDANFGHLLTFDGERFDTAAVHGEPRLVEHLRQRGPIRSASEGDLLGRIMAGEHLIQVADVFDTDEYRTAPQFREMVDLGGYRSLLNVALRKENVLFGMIVIFRKDIRLFSPKQIALVENFAAQAVIAMENARLITETREALEQQTATAEVLGVINSSPGDLAPVFDAMLERAVRLCEAAHGYLYTYDSERFAPVAMCGDATFADWLRQQAPIVGMGTSPHGRIAQGERFVHIADVLQDDAYRNQVGYFHEACNRAGTRTFLAVSLRKDDALLGTIHVYRREVRPFSDKQIALLQNFASQAVIAMENARLITETREALEQQTATAEVLQVINASPGDLAPVFKALLDKALRLCEASFGYLLTYDGEGFQSAADRGHPAFAAWVRAQGRIVPEPGTGNSRIASGERVIHIADAVNDPEYQGDTAMRRAVIEIGGFRTVLTVALRKDEALLGVIHIYRQEVRPFSDRQIALLQNFAAQAVIAMENARLLTETREALDQQTATAEVLGVINSSPGALAPVFEAMLEKAMRLCEASAGALRSYDGESFHAVAMRGVPAAFAEATRVVVPDPVTALGRIERGAHIIQIPDLTDPKLSQDNSQRRREMIDLGGIRTALWVALRKDDALLGTFVLYRDRVQPFTDKQIALVENFAQQAVIAMENARLINETRQRTAELQESLDYQTATSDVLKVISQSTSDLTPVLDFVCRTAARLCNVQTGSIFRLEEGMYRWATGFGLEPAYEAMERAAAIVPSMGTLVGRVALTGETVHILDGLADAHYEAKEELRLSKCHTMLGVPLLREGAVIGVICMARFAIDAFTEKQIALVSTFADQAVIAIENTRLFNELRDRTAEVTELNRGLEARVAEQVDELGRVGRLKRFLAPQLAELIVSRGDEKILESHRREIVVVFCDLRGYTAFTETAEPEEVLDFLREYHGALGPLVAQFEGTLDQFSGDGIMVFFNDPVPIPDPAERAVKMAMAMREEAGSLTATWRRRGRELGFGAGIAQGYATLGQIGFSERSGYTAIGTVCNVAARLCAEAKDEQILITQRVAAGLDGDIALEDMGPLPLKGITQPVVALNVTPPDAGAGRLRLIEP